ncbi:nuclear pore complex protein Nup205 isoform X2 [Nematostella vectensis]|uniref:nuclear pore complex protein Nup205 isoform X2 n=1 Tax=Nematostella vectensis TaxID=45351 RepID=UPI00207706DC|nr:nuclear pore complex protein Nup205 isoform X2 [Nematostella vectensis]
MAEGDRGIWKPYKELLAIVERAVTRKSPECHHDLEVALKKFKPDFIALLKNPAKNPNYRQQIKNAHQEGIIFSGRQEKQKLPEQFIQEALIISDILDLNELASVELLLAGEQQQPNFPGLTRGLVAVLLYHDGRRCLVSALKTLIQAREGITWTLGLTDDLCQLITKFTNELREEGLTATILNQLEQIDLKVELEKLQKGQAIGDEHHKRQLIDFITDQRQLLAECLYGLACQSPLPRNDCLQLLGYLKKCQSLEVDGRLDSVTLMVLMAMLYCLNVDPLDDANELQTFINEGSLPLLSDPSFIPDLHRELATSTWLNSGLLATIQFAWSLVLRSCSQWSSLAASAADILEEDEAVLDMAVEGRVFAFLRSSMVQASIFHHEDYFVRRLHSLITGFIVKMPLKVKELRNHGDEAARILLVHLQEGLEPPEDLPTHFEDLLLLIGDVYSKDPSGLELATDYWCVPDPVTTPFSPYARAVSPAYRQRLSSKQVSLNKFVHLAGDLLPLPLFVPYMDMLVGLCTSPQGAHHCFNMLKTTANSTVSWDHFFTAIKQYYMDLRQNGSQAGGEIHRAHSPNCSVSQTELEGLEAVLRVTERVADQDEVARIALCESQVWLPVASLFGLLGCSIPISLKACILNTLAAFAKSPEIAASMWHTLELAQVLQTVEQPGQTAQGTSGIQAELNELESRSEVYPETRAFLKLMAALTDIPVPTALGVGYRVPGFEPYLVFLRDQVLLKFSTRAYKDPTEKWQVACGVLEILFKLLDAYSPQPGDFVDQFMEGRGGERHLVPKPAGFSIMVHMMNDTQMLQMVLSIIDQASTALDMLTATSGKDELERATLLCLRVVEVTLERQETFMDMLRSVVHGSAVMVTPLQHLLMTVNPATQKADYLLKVTKYLTLSHISPELSLSAIKILCQVGQSQPVQSHLVGILTADKAMSQKILIGFVDHLDIDEPEEQHTRDMLEIGEEYLDEKSYDPTQLHNATRQNILQLLLYSLAFPAPNLAHFLLGFELRRPVSKTNIQLPGVLGAPKTCLHAIVDILNRGVDSHHGPTSIIDAPRFSALAYKLIYCLCANKDTFMPTLRFLRTSHDFLYQHLQHLPFKQVVAMESSTDLVPPLCIANQQSWLLRIAAIELKVTAQSRQRSHTQRLLGLLLNEPSTLGLLNASQMTDIVPHPDDDLSATNISLYQTALYAEPTPNQQPGRRKILSILDSVDFSQDFPPQLQLNYFDPGVMERVIASCELKSEETGVQYCNIRELNRLLRNEISNAQGPNAAGQKNFLFQEVKDILSNVVQRNMVRESLQAKKDAFESWRQVIEVALATCPGDILLQDVKQAVILETLQDLLMKIAQEDALQELTSPVSGVIMMLMTHLRHCTNRGNMTTPTSTLHTSTQDRSFAVSRGNVPSGPLFAVLRGIIEVVLRSGGGLQRVRANLYTALLYFMQIVQKPDDPKDTGVLEGVLSQPGQSWDLGTLSVLSSYGEPFMEMLCRDACDGHDIGRMLAFSLLNAIVNVDWQKRWLTYFSMKGFLATIVEGLSQEDEALQTMLYPSPGSLKALYVYESKMSLLTCIAQSQEGAQALMHAGLLARLAECSFLDQRPEYEFHSSMNGYGDEDSFVPSVMDRYRQLLLPALQVISTILASLGPQHREASMKVLGVVVSHADVFTSILQDRTPVHTPSSLQELALITGIICNAALTETSVLDEDTILEDEIKLRGPLARIQRLMLALLPKYCSSENWDKVIKTVAAQNSPHQGPSSKLSPVAMETAEMLHRICCNVIGYCRTIVSSSGSAKCNIHVVFGPSMADILTRDTHRTRTDSYRAAAVHTHRPPSLGVLVTVIKGCADQMGRAVDVYKQTSLKQQNMAELTGEELRELSQLQATAAPTDKMSTGQRQQLAYKCLTQIVDFKQQEIYTHLYIIESSLFILWRHLDYFYLRCIPSDEENTLLNQGQASTRMRRLQEFSVTDNQSRTPQHKHGVTGDGVTRDEIQTLKQEASSCVTDVLLKKLVDLEQNHGKARSRMSFIQVLVRRVKRLLTLHGIHSLDELGPARKSA